jgi:ferredoxin
MRPVLPGVIGALDPVDAAYPLTPREGRSRTIGEMRVTVDQDKCEGHNRCYSLAPELFDVDDFGQAVVIGDGTVTDDLADKARLAVANCPEYAITLEDGDE